MLINLDLKSDILVQTKTHIGLLLVGKIFLLISRRIAPDIKPIPNHTRHEWAPWDAYISAAEPDTLFEEYRSKGVAFNKPIHDNSDNLRGFEIKDADGYVLFFGRPNLLQLQPTNNAKHRILFNFNKAA